MSLLSNMLSRFEIAFLLKEQVSLDFMVIVTICSDFGAQENQVCHCFHCFPMYLPWNDGTGSHDLCFLNVECQFFPKLIMYLVLVWRKGNKCPWGKKCHVPGISEALEQGLEGRGSSKEGDHYLFTSDLLKLDQTLRNLEWILNRNMAWG